MRANEFLNESYVQNKNYLLESNTRIILGLNENFDRSIILHEQLLYENFLDSIGKFLKNKASDTINDIQSNIRNAKDSGILIRDVIKNEDLLGSVQSMLGKYIRSKLKSLSPVFDSIIEKMPKLSELVEAFRKNVTVIINKIFKVAGWKGFLIKLGILVLFNFIQQKLSSLKTDLVVDFFSNMGETIIQKFDELVVMVNMFANYSFQKYIEFFSEIKELAMILFDVLSSLKKKFDFTVSAEQT